MPETPYLLAAAGGPAVPARPRLPALLGRARRLIAEAVGPAPTPRGSATTVAGAARGAPGPVLLGCSGGADSMALAIAAAYFSRTGKFEIGAVVVDHRLQPGSTAVAQRTADVLRALGLSPVEVRTAQVGPGMGPEAAARTARYQQFSAAIQTHHARALLLGHTMNDQAEQVLLGLARGSGTRSLAGIPAQRELAGAQLLRPFLELGREQTEQLCRLGGVVPWQDPSNADPQFARNRVRHQVLPALEQQLGGQLVQALARSAQILSQDADALDEIAEREFGDVAMVASRQVVVDIAALSSLPAAVRQRVLRLAVTSLGAPAPTLERVQALSRLARNQGSAGPVQVPGGVRAYRQNRAQRLSQKRDGAGCGNIVFTSET